ncbi:MAG: putative nucleotidyltransferase with HDIG domain [Myxococcota bacterium]
MAPTAKNNGSGAPEGPITPSLLERIRSPVARRIIALFVLSVGMSLLVVEYVRVPTATYDAGEVAERDIRAAQSFNYTDWEESLERERRAEESVLPVYDYDATSAGRLQERVLRAFSVARNRHTDAVLAARMEGGEVVDEATLNEITRDFHSQLELSLSPESLQSIVNARWSERIGRLAGELIGWGMQGYIVADQALLPAGSPSLSVVRIFQDSRDEVRLDDYDQIKVPTKAREMMGVYALNQLVEVSDEQRVAALALASAAVRPNFSYNQLLTEDRRRDKRDKTAEVIIQVQRGTAIIREGDVLTRQQVEMLNALQDSQAGYGMFGVILALMAFCGLLFGTLYNFGSEFIKKFSTRPEDIEAIAFLALLTALIARVFVAASVPMASVVGLGIAPSSLWYAAPFAGGAMLVRILVNSETALIWVLATSAMLGLMMDQEVLLTLFFAISGITAVSGIAHTRERANVLRAGVVTGAVSAGAVLLIQLIQVHLSDSPAMAESAQPIWDVAFAFTSGILSAFLVLGLVPIFELFGFVTDFKLLELANLNHPLLRQLMLRAPGTYHHSMTVASLSEAAAESIGAHTLRTRVACYFHDIGKALQPQFFIENQRGGPNPHDRLKPHQSARVIINHVVDGAAIGEQHKLPEAVLDAILMHHGTSIIKYFYVKALEQAGPDEIIDEGDFRYPGVRPNTREAGIIFLADRVEAACRTIKEPTAHNFRSMIQKLVNDAVTDGQLEECPLTLKELYTIIDAFTNTLLGIHHHRIEYPLLPPIRRSPRDAMPSSPIITLEMTNPLAGEHARKADAEESSEEAPPAPDEPPSPLPPVPDEPQENKPDAG